MVLAARKETRAGHCGNAHFGTAVLFQEDAQTARHALRRPSISQNAAKATYRAQPGGSPSHDRWDDEPHASHDIDGAVWDRGASDRTLTAEGDRHRQQPHGGPYPTR